MLKFRTYRGNRYAGIGLDEDLFQLLRMQLWKRYWKFEIELDWFAFASYHHKETAWVFFDTSSTI